MPDSQSTNPHAPPTTLGYDIGVARTRITRIFRYLQELHRVRTPPAVHLNSYDWRLQLASLPHYPSIQRGPLFSNLKLPMQPNDILDGDFILRIGRPKESECPPPSVVIEQWLQPGWNNAALDPKVYTKRRLKTAAGEESFDSSDGRVEALHEWLATRQQWANAEKKTLDALSIFSELFELWGRFARESEKYQLFLADGVLVVAGR